MKRIDYPAIAGLIVLWALIAGLCVSGGCVSVKRVAQQAQDNLSQISGHASAAHDYLLPHVHENVDIQNADAEVQKIPPLADKTSGQVTTLTNQYNAIYNSWYARAGRFIDASFWTVVIAGVLALFVVGAVNFYSGGTIGTALRAAAEFPTWIIHWVVTSVAGWFKGSSTAATAAATSVAGKG